MKINFDQIMKTPAPAWAFRPLGQNYGDQNLSFIQHNYGMPGSPEEAYKHANNEFIRTSKLLNRQGKA